MACDLCGDHTKKVQNDCLNFYWLNNHHSAISETGHNITEHTYNPIGRHVSLRCSFLSAGLPSTTTLTTPTATAATIAITPKPLFTTTTTITTTSTIKPDKNTTRLSDVYVAVSASEPWPFITDGTRALTLTCDLDMVLKVMSYVWNVPCLRQKGNSCVFTPLPAEDDGKVATCTVTLLAGLEVTGSLKINLNCKYSDGFMF